MQTVTSAKMRWLAALGSCLTFILWCSPLRHPAARQSPDQAKYAAELRQLRDQLAASDSLRDADVVAVLSQRTLAAAARQLIGLEVTLAGGALLRLTSVVTELKPAAALVRLGVQASPSAGGPAALDLSLTGRLGSGEINGSALRLPFQLTEVSLGSGEQPSPLLRGLFSDWLSPERWNAALPPLEIPLELSEVMEIPAGRFDVEGTMPMEIATPAYQVRVNFAVISLMFLNGRAVVALRLAPDAAARENAATLSGRPEVNRAPTVDASEGDVAALEAEVTRLSQGLVSDGDLRLRLRRRVINSLLDQVATARDTDLTLRLKPARVRSEEVTGLIRTLNYTDVEGGDGRADLRGLVVERIAGNRLDLRLTAQGSLEARLRGREYGIPYRLSPNGTFAIKGEVVPLEVAGEGDRALLRAVPGSQLPVQVRMEFEIAGHNLGLSRTVTVPADRWFNRLALPSLVGRELQVPRKIEAGSGGMRVVSSESSRYSLSKLRVKAHDDAVEITSDVSVSPR